MRPIALERPAAVQLGLNREATLTLPCALVFGHELALSRTVFGEQDRARIFVKRPLASLAAALR